MYFINQVWVIDFLKKILTSLKGRKTEKEVETERDLSSMYLFPDACNRHGMLRSKSGAWDSP